MLKPRKWLAGVFLFVLAIATAISLSHVSGSYSSLVAEVGYSQNLSNPVASPVRFPSNYREQFVHYATVDCPRSRMVRQMYVDRPSLALLKSSTTIPSGTTIVMETYSAQKSGDRLTPTQLNNVFVREKRAGWQVSSRSGEWQSAWYSPGGALVSGDQSACIGCHTRVRDRDYTFTLPALLSATKTGNPQYQQTEFGTSVCR